MLRGAISGFGEVAAQAHLPAWTAHPEISLVAIHDPIAARRHAAINLVKNIRVYDDLDLMLAGEALDFVDVASPPAFHAVTARTALEAGANVLVEKPLCLGRAEFSALHDLAARQSRVLMCVHNWKHAPAYRRAHELIASGRIGVPDYLSFVRLRSAPAGSASVGAAGERWRLERKAGGGILIDHGWHVFYLAQWLMGGVGPLAVSAHLGSQPGSKVDDLADLRIEFPQGAIAYAHLSWRAPSRRTNATIYGPEGMIEIDGGRLILTDLAGRASDSLVDEMSDDSYHSSWFVRIADDFKRAIEEGPNGPIAEENRAEADSAVRLTEAASQSASSGTRIAVR